MEQDILTRIGLSMAEAKVYRALCKLGSSTTGAITQESGVATSNLYFVLERLIELGLVSFHKARNIKHFQPTPPENLLRVYDQKTREILELKKSLNAEISKLFIINQLPEADGDIKVYEGIGGVKSAIENVLIRLKKGETYYVLGAPASGNKRLNPYFRDFHERRVRKGIIFKAIYSESAREYAKERKASPLSQIRVSDINTPAELCVYGETAQIIIISDKLIVFEMKNSLVAKSFLEYFNKIWVSGREA